MNRSFDLTGKSALVTGCNRGIGFAMALGLAEAGADIIGVSATLEPEGSAIGRAVTALGRSFAGYRCDFSERSDVHDFAARLLAERGTPDILVNNAGMIRREAAATHPDEMWDQVIEVNLSAQFVLSREIGARMVARGSGKIIFVASVLACQGGILVPGYAASKGAIVQLTKALANEWAASGVNVNAIAPGYCTTDNTEALRNDPDRSAAILARIPADRWGAPDDFKGPVVFLASQASSYMHGATVVVDGGWLGR
jgi:2-deoxy-D-gluconate 3-dehydrogenase